jgi:hypothetical protein
LPQSHGVDGQRAQAVTALDHEAVVVLLGKLSGGADDLVDQRRQLHTFTVEFKLAGFDLREVEHLIDEA